MSNADSWLPEENMYDLTVSCCRLHQVNDQEEMFRKYLRCLQPDGALVGTSFV